MKKQRQSAADESLPETQPSAGTAPPRRRRFPTFTLTAIGTLLLLIALAPSIVSVTPLGPQLVASAAGGSLNGSVQASSVGIGWLSSLTLRGVTVRDADQKVVATADSIVVGKSLLGLLLNQSDLGTITIDKPEVLLVLRSDGSNLEDLLQPLLTKPSSGGATPALRLEVSNGQLKLIDGSTEQSWELSALNAKVASPQSGDDAWRAALEAKLGDAGIVARVDQALGTGATTKATLEADRFPLEPLQPVLTRVLGPTRLSGALTGKVDAELASGGKQLKLQLEKVEAVHLVFSNASLLARDTVQLSQVQANGSMTAADGLWQFRDLEVKSDVAALVGSGDVRLSDFTGAQAIPQTDCDIQGVVDLARLTQMLPATLRAREDVQITSGQARFGLASQAAGAGRRLTATLSTDHVRATSGGRSVQWEEPLTVNAAAMQTVGGWQLERVDARSSFLAAEGSGTLDQGKVTLRGDLNKLAEQLDQFIEMGDMRLAGQLAGALEWQQEQAGSIGASGQLKFTGFELAMPGVMPWRERDLVAQFQVSGIAPTNLAAGIRGGKLSVQSGQDELDVVLAGAAAQGQGTPLNANLTGDLATWVPRLQAFLPVAGWQVSGPVSIAAKGIVAPQQIDLTEARFDVKQLHVAGHGLFIDEPELSGQATATYSVTSGALSIPSALVQGQTVAASVEKLVVQSGKDAKISGEVAARGDVGRLMAWITDPAVAATSQFAGEAEAEATFTFAGGVTQANLRGQIANLAYLTREAPAVTAGRPGIRPVSTNAAWETMWEEPVVTFGGKASYDATKDSIALEKMQAEAGTSAVAATGNVSQLSSRCLLDVTGEVRYDLATWTPKLQPVLGQTFDMYGGGTRAFELHGPLFERTSTRTSDAPLLPLALTGKASVGWKGAQWMALQVGEAEVAAELKDSTIFVQPTKIPLSQGTLALSPQLLLKGPSWTITHEKARVIDHIVITPQMCSAWIKYVLPTLADATEAQGKFSVDIDQAAVPLSQPKQFDTKGTFTVHNVSVGPGPLARQLIDAARQVKAFADGKMGLDGLAGVAGNFVPGLAGVTPAAEVTAGKQWLELPEQEVPVEAVQGRVYHQNLTMKVQNLTFRSSGSVGIADQALDLMIDFVPPDEWFKDPKLAGLKGQVIKIPVKGTLYEQKIDRSFLTSNLVNLGGAGIRGAIGSKLQDGLQGGQNAVQGQISEVETRAQQEIEKGKQKLEDGLRKGLKGLFK
jgi:hypothetical protein